MNAPAVQTTIPKDVKVSFKPTRADLINQVISESRANHEAAIAKAKDARDAAVQRYVDAVHDYAIRKCKHTIDALKKVAISGERVTTNFSYNVYYDRNPEEVVPTSNDVKVGISSTNNTKRYYDRFWSFEVILKLTKPLQQLRDKADQAAEALWQVKNADTRIVTMTRDVRDKIVRQSLDNSPEGKAMLEAMRALVRQVESNGKNILEG